LNYNSLKIKERDSFIVGVIIGLVMSRIAGIIDTLYDNPNPIIIMDVEMHHFWYGMLLIILLIPLYFLIFYSKPLIVLTIGFGLGVMLDDVILIMSLEKIRYEDINQYYMDTLYFTLFLITLFSLLLVFSIYSTIKMQVPNLSNYIKNEKANSNLRINKKIIENLNIKSSRQTQIFINKIKKVNAIIHLNYLCKICLDDTKQIRDIYNEGNCYWCKEWENGNYKIPIWMGIREWFRIHFQR